MTLSEMSLKEFIAALKPGEDVLIEYSSTSPMHIVFHGFLTALKSLNKPFMIVDELDQLKILRAHLSVMGVGTELIDTSKVVKIGGVVETGSVVGRIDLTKEPPLRKRHYEEILSRLGDEKQFRLVVGFDKVLASHENDPREKERIFGHLFRPHLGDPGRITVYFVNKDLVSERTLHELREHCTRVLDLVMEEKIFLKILKSVFPEEYGLYIEV